MTAKPPPGPWKYVPSTEHHGPYVACDHGSIVSYPAGGYLGYTAETTDAIARLIGTAPTMLATLKDILDFLKRSGYDTRLVKEVIAEAEGQS